MSKELTEAQRKYWERRLRWLDAWSYGDPRCKCNQKQQAFEEQEIVPMGATTELEEIDGYQQRVNRKTTCNCQIGETVDLYNDMHNYCATQQNQE